MIRSNGCGPVPPAHLKLIAHVDATTKMPSPWRDSTRKFRKPPRAIWHFMAALPVAEIPPNAHLVFTVCAEVLRLARLKVPYAIARYERRAALFEFAVLHWLLVAQYSHTLSSSICT